MELYYRPLIQQPRIHIKRIKAHLPLDICHLPAEGRPHQRTLLELELPEERLVLQQAPLQLAPGVQMFTEIQLARLARLEAQGQPVPPHPARFRDFREQGDAQGQALYRKFYLVYPHLSGIAGRFAPLPENLQPLAEDLTEWQLPAETLLKRLSFMHFVEFLKINNPMQRLFYEMECIKGNWSRRQLQRQIGSLLYERTGLSRNKEALLAQIKDENSAAHIADFIREPYVFEFLGLRMEDAFLESNLEKALLEHLQTFLLELGNGFCFEARQKSFLIDNRRYKIDLLFYHRILKCHVVVDLKTRQFEPEDAGQMNFYLNYHR